MRSYLPTIRQLQYLLALEEHGHFGRAAEACHVSQSTLSAGIEALESLLGIILVERTQRVVRFTHVGKTIATKAHRLLREAEEIADMASATSEPFADALHMSVIPTIAPFLLPQLLPQLRSQVPQLRLFLREETSDSACQSLHSGKVDCALLALPYPCGDVETAILFEDRLRLAFPEAQAQALPKIVSADMLDPTQMLMLEDGHCLKDHALAACNRSEFINQVQMIGTSLHTLVQMVDNGLGITMLPQMAIDSGILSKTSIALRSLDSEPDCRTIALIWRRGAARSQELQALAKMIRNFAS